MGVVSRSLIVMYNLARKILQHRLYYTAINNVMYVVKTPYNSAYCFLALPAVGALLNAALLSLCRRPR